MTPKEYDDVKQLYQFTIAFEAFMEVSKTCAQILAQGLKPADPLYHTTTVGILTLYSRPFTRSAIIGRLPTDLVPTKYKALHSALMDLRRKAFAHSDHDGQLIGHGKMTDVRILFGPETVLFSSRATITPPLLPELQALSTLLAEEVGRCRDVVYKRFMEAIRPSLGRDDIGKEFEINVEDEKGPMILLSQEPIRKKYPFIGSSGA